MPFFSYIVVQYQIFRNKVLSMKEHLKEIQDAIHSILIYSDVNARHYIGLLKDAIKTIESIEADQNSELEISKNEALVELSNELANRVNDNFFKADPERKRSEFKFSKSVANISISNVLSNY
jgi:hypothetical protein